MASSASQAEERRPARWFGLARRPGEHWTRFAARIADAFGLVLLLVIGTYVLESLVPYQGWGAVAIAAVAAAASTFALASSRARPGLVRTGAGLAAVAVVLAVVAAAAGRGLPLAVSALIQTAVLAVAIAFVLGAVVSEREVSGRTILGAISVYVTLGLLFTFLYASIDRLQPGAFFGTPAETGDYIFFSITTLTTTGYGNLVPAGQPGIMFAGLEMLVGQIFLVTLIAGLVSLWRPGAFRGRGDENR